MNDWVAKPVFHNKTKPHVGEILCAVLKARATGNEPEEVAVRELPKNIIGTSTPSTQRGGARASRI